MLPIMPSVIGIVGKIWSWAVAWHRSRLSLTESRMLTEAASTGGIITKLKTGQTGEFVMVGPTAYLDDNEPLKRVEALQALDSLIKRGFLYVDNNRYLLTQAGFKKARKC